MDRRLTAALLVLAVASSGCTADRQRVAVSSGASAECGWSSAGNGLARLGATACPQSIDVDNVARLNEVWFAPTDAEVSAAPGVDETAVYAGDWSGVVSSWNRTDGSLRWSVSLGVDPVLYSGQFTSSPALTSISGTDAVVIAGGRRTYALDRADGSVIWEHRIGDPDDPGDPSEIEGSPAVTDASVVVGFDVHNDPTRRAGVISLDLLTGREQWRWDPEVGLESGGCGDVWGSPAVDTSSGLVVVGTASCPRPGSWGPYAEAIVGLDLETGAPQWSFQPHQKGNQQDWDFAGAPNLFEIGARPVVGLGNKDGWYYVVDRTTGELIWQEEAQRQAEDGDGFAFGGFIGATAVTGDVIVGATAVGDCPCVHAFDAASGRLRWQSREPSGSYATAGATGDLVFIASIDQTLRAFLAADGAVVWSWPTRAISTSGPAIAGRELFLGVGFTEPGTSGGSLGAGVQAFRVLDEGETAPIASTTSSVPELPPLTALAGGPDRCVSSPCPLDTTLKDPPPGTSPELTLAVALDPLAIDLRASGLGEPAAWLRPGSAAERAGATVFGLYASPRDDQPELGSIVCTFTADQPGCRATSLRYAAEYTRLTVIALVDSSTPPTLQDGFDRLVTTRSIDPPFTPA